MVYILKCKYCGIKFETTNFNQKFCCKKCSAKYQQKTAINIVTNYKNIRIRQYEEAPKLCKCCGSPLKYEDKYKTFCNSSCAATYNNSQRIRKPWSEEQKQKLSKKIANKYQTSTPKQSTYTPRKITCKVCGREFISKQLPSGKYSCSKFCSNECKKINNIEIGKRALQINKAKGTWRPWIKRNISSYPEIFFENVLNNNSIEFEREKYIDGYFLDFYIELNQRKIDLEIDGGQHKTKKEHDQQRDAFLNEKGIEVYRISWNSINSISGKNIMKTKIDEFLQYLNK